MHDLMLLWMQSSPPLIFRIDLSHCRIVRQIVTLVCSHRNVSISVLVTYLKIIKFHEIP